MRYLSMIAAAVLAGVSPAFAAVYFNDSSKVNVMRQFADGGVFLVPHTNSATGGVGFDRDAPNDGAHWNTESTNNFTSSSATITQTFTLGGPGYTSGPSTVGSLRAEWDGAGRRPSEFLLERSLDGVSWSPLYYSNSLPNSDTLDATFTALPAKYVRYTATGPAASDNRFGLSELQIFLSTGQTIETNDGYNFMNDFEVAGQLAKGNSSNVNNWRAPNGGGPAPMVDGRMTTAETKAQNGDADDRAYIIYQLSAQQRMDLATLGASKDQSWGNWELYTSNSTASLASIQADLNALSASEIADIESLGWVRQWTQLSNVGSPGFNFLFDDPGMWQNVLVVWDVQGGGMRELQIFAVPEPASLGLLSCAGLLLCRRSRSK